jgi:predicted nucleic acid-binding Zn ribbon protein
MPVYTYRHIAPLTDEQCARPHVFEEVQRITEPVLPTCSCCGQPVERVIPTGTSFRFKNGSPTPRFHR